MEEKHAKSLSTQTLVYECGARFCNIRNGYLLSSKGFESLSRVLAAELERGQLGLNL